MSLTLAAGTRLGPFTVVSGGRKVAQPTIIVVQNWLDELKRRVAVK